MGGGKSSGSQTVQMTPEQAKLVSEQTKFLTETAFPAYQKTIAGGQDVYQQAGQFPIDQGARSNLQPPEIPQGGMGKGASSIQPSNMTISSTSGQPTTGQPNPYPNTTGSWDNSATQQPPAQMSGGKGKGA